MYVVIVYDVTVARLDKVRMFLKKYLDWMQNSVFEGEVTKAKLKEIEIGVKELIDEDEDSVIVYVVRDQKLLGRTFIGSPKVEPTNVL
jgi:CRISPR-associated protein Cas2